MPSHKIAWIHDADQSGSHIRSPSTTSCLTCG